MPATIVRKLQPVAGVSVGYENVVEVLYPSITASGLGRMLAGLYDSIPVRVWGLKLSNLLFCLPTAPLGALIYLLQKVVGEKYVVTNRVVKRCDAMGVQLRGSAALSDVADVRILEETRSEFFATADLELLNSSGAVVLKLPAVGGPERFAQVIREAADAKRQVESSLKAIHARHA